MNAVHTNLRASTFGGMAAADRGNDARSQQVSDGPDERVLIERTSVVDQAPHAGSPLGRIVFAYRHNRWPMARIPHDSSQRACSV